MEERTWKEMRTKALSLLEIRFSLLGDAKLDVLTTSYLMSCGMVESFRSVGLITPQEGNDWEKKFKDKFFEE